MDRRKETLNRSEALYSATYSPAAQARSIVAQSIAGGQPSPQATISAFADGASRLADPYSAVGATSVGRSSGGGLGGQSQAGYYTGMGDMGGQGEDAAERAAFEEYINATRAHGQMQSYTPATAVAPYSAAMTGMVPNLPAESAAFA